jgi:FkbM family methyltransferase
MGQALRAALRTVRDVQARTLAALVTAIPALESPFIAAGRVAARRSPLLGGLYWHAHEHLTSRLRRSGRRHRRISVRGIALDLDVTDRTGRLHYFHDEPYEPAVLEAIHRALSPGDVFIDIGANIGFFSVFAARIVGRSGRVFAFEPHPAARDALVDLAARNGVTDVIEIVPLALSDREGDATLHLNREFTSYSTLDPLASPMRASAAFTESLAIRMTTMDRWMTDHPGIVPRIRCIKIDVEGTESAVLSGMTHLIERLHAPILCETSIDSEADRALIAHGFVRYQIEPGAYGNHLYRRDGASVER